VAKAILYADRAGRVPPEVAQEWLQRAARQGDVADVPAGNSPFVAGQPLVTVFASGNSLAGVEDTLRGTAGEAYERLGLPGPLAN
jgi:predicted ATP-grasp superfamily ATP-dependent carboligase